MSRIPMRCGDASFFRSRVPKLRSYDETRVRTHARSASFSSQVTSSGSAASDLMAAQALAFVGSASAGKAGVRV